MLEKLERRIADIELEIAMLPEHIIDYIMQNDLLERIHLAWGEARTDG